VTNFFFWRKGKSKFKTSR